MQTIFDMISFTYRKKLIKMNKILVKSTAILPIVVGTMLFAQENEFDMNLQLRPRTEYRNGAYRPLQTGEEPAILTHNRTRLTMNYSNGDKLKMRVSLQNINIWGQANQVQPLDATNNNIGLFEAYADIKLSENMRTKIGRQTISLDEERLFAVSKWNPSGRSHDLVNISWKKQNTDVQSYFAFNQHYANEKINSPSGQSFFPEGAHQYQHMEMLYVKHNFTPKHYLSVLFNNVGFKNIKTDNKMYNMQTFGAYYLGNGNLWDVTLSAYYQFGKTELGKKTSATLLSAVVDYKINKPSKIGLGIDYLSGDDTNKNTQTSTNVFNTLYGINHKFYGSMDYFFVNPHGNVGLLDTYIRYSSVINPKLSISAVGHLFNSGAKIYQNNQKKSNYLGSELDLSFNYNIMNNISLTGGYSNFFNTESLRYLKKTPNARGNQDWVWISLNINPQIFKAKF